MVAPVVPPVVQWVHRARDQGGVRELGRRFWRCGFSAFLVCVRWCHSAPYLPSRETEKGVAKSTLSGSVHLGSSEFLLWTLTHR